MRGLGAAHIFANLCRQGSFEFEVHLSLDAVSVEGGVPRSGQCEAEWRRMFDLIGKKRPTMQDPHEAVAEKNFSMFMAMGGPESVEVLGVSPKSGVPGHKLAGAHAGNWEVTRPTRPAFNE